MLAVGAALSMLLALTGCGAFFQCEGKTSCGTGSTSTGTGDYVYVSNSPSSVDYVNAYTVGTGTLTAITGSPFNVGYVPVAMKVSPNDDFLYMSAAAGTTATGLYVYPITSTGALGTPTELITNTEIDSLDISPDGNFLFTIGPDSLGTPTLTEYALVPSTGAISGTGGTSYALPGGTTCGLIATIPVSQTCTVQVSPSEDFVGVAAGIEGTYIFPYTSSNGITTANYSGVIQPASGASGDYSLAFDKSGFVYIARTAELSPYGSLSVAAPLEGVSYTGYASGATPRGVTLSTAYNYLYTADEGTSTISEFSVSSGVLTAFSTPTVLGPTNVSALGVDRSGTYLLAAGYNSTNGLQMFTISSTTLAAVASQGTGGATTVPVVMALTH